MDFFAQQARSRTRALYLIVLFMAAVILVTVAVYFAIKLVFFLAQLEENARGYSDFQWVDTRMLSLVAMFTLAVIILASVIKIVQMSKGSGYVAENLGGRVVNRSSADRNEKRLLNVVIEMAIASGVPVPPVYLLDKEEGINAFAAGYTLSDAVIAVTRGSMEKLNRTELQGIIAHEFSHILNGDMRLNIRLIGFLYGIMVIANIGQAILRGTRRSSSKKDSGKAVLFAIALVVIGYIGQFFGRMIQCAVCRQREFLADASAVQFTRNPDGIAGALKKIGTLAKGSRIDSPNTPEVSHLFFAMAIRSLFATHPPLDERIRRIEPGFKGKVTEYGRLELGPGLAGVSGSEFDPSVSRMAVDSQGAQRHVGQLTAEHVDYSSALLATLPQQIKDELEDMLGATAIVGAMLLDRNPAERDYQIRALQKVAAPEIVEQTLRFEKEVKKIQSVFHLPVLNLAIQTLRGMSPAQYAGLIRSVQALVEADGKLTIFEFVLKKMVTHQLGVVYSRSKRQPLIKNMSLLVPHAVNLLSMLAKAGHSEIDAARKAFDFGFERLRSAGVLQPEALCENVSFDTLDKAFDYLAKAAPGIKRAIFDACCNCVFFDKNVSIAEAELLRAAASIMDIPVPPFITGKQKNIVVMA
ncbi:MAG: hypothetical protein AUJ48_03660 [Deltaproteobacteria bacterium CG1_02_45_11]|nr:MAG: hypothetical protein AUJ48_03660 [Deltaproteobacteria bacterium CG1_02_45_11]